MPRLTQSLPKYRKHRASGQAVVTIGGRDHYLGPHRSRVSRVLYDRLMAEYLANGRLFTPQDPGSGGVPVSKVLKAYWQFCTGYYVKNGVQTNECEAIRLVLADTLPFRDGPDRATATAPLLPGLTRGGQHALLRPHASCRQRIHNG